MTPTLRIHLLGGFQLISGETPVSGIDVLRLQSLLAYLLLHQDIPQSRAHLAFVFWPDSTDSQAHTNLRNIVHKLRQTLPNAEHYLQVERQTLSALYEETEGNPLFVVETVRAGSVEKVKTGQLSLEGAFTRPGASLPPTVQAVILSRFAQLASTAREVMGVAAVIGRAFTFGVLKQASSMDEDALVLGLDELWQRRVVREQGGDAYDFSHDKLREQAYNSLSTARKRLLHRRVGDALVTVHGHDADMLNAISEQIATHYEQAGAVEQAITYHIRAAEEAGRVYANSEALAFYWRVLHLLEKMPSADSKHEWRQATAMRCHERIGDILTITGEAEAAKDAYQSALALVSDQERIRRAGFLRKLAHVWHTQRRYEEALHINHDRSRYTSMRCRSAQRGSRIFTASNRHSPKDRISLVREALQCQKQ